MNTFSSKTRKQQAIYAEALKWHIDAGADEAINDIPTNFLALTKTAKQSSESDKTLPTNSVNEFSKNEPKTQKKSSINLNTNNENFETAEKLAEKSLSLSSLKRNISKFEGCRLKSTATNLVFGAGQVEADVMFIGEAPGREEDRDGAPFIGVSGQLLDLMLSYIGLSRDQNIYITNILPWRPPGNRHPTDTEVASCMPFVKRHIQLVSPGVLVLLGGAAYKALTNNSEGITRVRGKWFEYEQPVLSKAETQIIPTVATLHPAYILRQPAQKKAIWKDLISVRNRLNNIN